MNRTELYLNRERNSNRCGICLIQIEEDHIDMCICYSRLCNTCVALFNPNSNGDEKCEICNSVCHRCCFPRCPCDKSTISDVCLPCLLDGEDEYFSMCSVCKKPTCTSGCFAICKHCGDSESTVCVDCASEMENDGKKCLEYQ